MVLVLPDRTHVRYTDGTAYMSEAGAALTRNPASWAARSILQRRAAVPDVTALSPRLRRRVTEAA